MDATRSEQPSVEILDRWGLTVQRDLGGNTSQHWLVVSEGTPRVLRCSSSSAFGDIAYEFDVLRRLRSSGWPVPEPTSDPHVSHEQTWCLFSWLPGAPRDADTSAERRARGRLLAQLHEAMASIPTYRQRSGFSRSDDVLRDPGLLHALDEFAALFPPEASLMRRYAERGIEILDGLDLDRADSMPIHSDFARWNLLFEGNHLSGILDFEWTHRNFRVADFALSWRGNLDEVIAGYEEVRPLSELDWQLLLPVFWSWLFLGAKDQIDAMMSGEAPAHGFEWTVKHLIRRSLLVARHVTHYNDLPVAVA